MENTLERAVLLYTTWPSFVEAEGAGHEIVKRRLAACVKHPAWHGVAILVEGRDRAGRGDGDDRQDPRLAGRCGKQGGQGTAQLRDAGDHGAAGGEHRSGLPQVDRGGDDSTVAFPQGEGL